MSRAVFLAVDPPGTVLPLHLYHTSRPKPVFSAAPQGPVPQQAFPILCTMWLEDNTPWGARDSPSFHWAVPFSILASISFALRDALV